MYQDWINVLNSSPLFQGIGPEALNTMLECLKPKVKKYKLREIVAVSGHLFQGVGVVASGRVILSKDTYSGNRIILEILKAGEIFGETAAFCHEKVWPVTVIAEEDSSVLFLPPDKILGNCTNICASHSQLIKNTVNILSNRANTFSKKIQHLSARTVRGKISSYLLDMYRDSGNAAFMLPMKRHDLADYLAMPRPSLSRELCLMRDAGIIDFDGASITVRNIIQLEKSIE